MTGLVALNITRRNANSLLALANSMEKTDPRFRELGAISQQLNAANRLTDFTVICINAHGSILTYDVTLPAFASDDEFEEAVRKIRREELTNDGWPDAELEAEVDSLTIQLAFEGALEPACDWRT